MKNDYSYRTNFVKEYGQLVRKCGLDYVRSMKLIDGGDTVFMSMPKSGSRCIRCGGDSLFAITEDICRQLYGDTQFDKGYDYATFAVELGNLIVKYGKDHYESCGIEFITYDDDTGYATIHFHGGGTHTARIKGIGILQAAREIARASY